MEVLDGGITWLASYPKSGNTWLRYFLACYLNDGAKINFNALPRELTYADHRDQDYHSISPYPVSALSSTEILMLRGAVLIKLLADTQVRPILIKTHHANATLDHVRMIPPILTKNAVYVARDPRDVVVSMAKWTGATIDETIDVMNDPMSIIHSTHGKAQTLFHYLGQWSRHVRSWTEADFDVLVINYERILEDPEYIFTEVLTHIGWEVDYDRVKRSVEVVAFDQMKAFEEKHGMYERPPDVKAFFRSGTSGQWKNELTSEQCDRIASEHGDMMGKLGYL